MNKKIFVVLITVLFMIYILSGCTWFSNDEDEYGEGFDETDLVTPEIPSYSPHIMPEKPEVNESQLPPGFSYNLSWAMGEVYSDWGGFIVISCENTGINDIFVYRYGIEINWSFPPEWIYEERNVLIAAGEERQLGIVYFEAPKTTGNYSYNVLMTILVKDNELFTEYDVESWYDNGTVHSKENSLFVKPLHNIQELKIVHNYKYYYDKLKSKVDFDNYKIQNLVSEISEKYPGEYNIYQILAIFDFMLYNLTYISDPEGRDYWAFCSETIDKGGGDCEDLSILFSSMIGAIGGTTRIYLTQTHAFSALYIGSESSKNEILGAIELYYGTEPNYVIFKDEQGYWLATDPTGTLYMGGLPADAEPAIVSENPLVYGFNFYNTTKIHVIDVVG